MRVLDPYGRRGLKRNPFAWNEHGQESGPLLDRVATRAIRVTPGQGRLVELVGGKGAGKTTQLEIWAHRFNQTVHTVGDVRAVKKDRRSFRSAGLPVDALCFWDEVDRLSPRQLGWALRRAASKNATVVVGTHTSIAHVGERQGLLVTSVALPTVQFRELQLWAQSRVDHVLLSPGQPAAERHLTVPDHVLRRAVLASDGNWRKAGDFLHAWMAELVTAPLPAAF